MINHKALKAFKEIHGHCNVPSKYADNPQYSAEIYMGVTHEYCVTLRSDSRQVEMIAILNLNTALLLRAEEVYRLAMRITKRSSHLLHCIDALSDAHSLHNVSQLCSAFQVVMQDYAQSGEEMVLGREGEEEDLVPDLFPVLRAVLAAGLAALKQTDDAHEADKVEGGGPSLLQDDKGVLSLTATPRPSQ